MVSVEDRPTNVNILRQSAEAYMRLPESRAFFVVFSDWTIANSLYPAHEV